MRSPIWTPAALAMALLYAQPAAAAPLLDLSGTISLADGASPAGSQVKLQIDLDGNGKFSGFETLSAKVGERGRYTLAYELDLGKIDLEFLSFVRKLLSDFDGRGFEALLDRGALPVMITVQRPGYSTITRRFSTLFASPTLDLVLAPLAEIKCDRDSCMTGGGSVRLSGFDAKTRLGRAFAQAYDPTLDAPQFPGSFSDNQGNLLISSGFAEINLFDAQDKPVHELAAPVDVRFAMDRTSWSTLPDLNEGSGKIELPMYSFDAESGEWVREGDGELQRADGTPVPERSAEAIRQGTFADDVYVAFSTKHFSTFNCDEPRSGRACVKGRLVDEEGAPLSGVMVTVEGESYSGNAGSMMTGAAGYFAADVLRSEPDGQDLDRNGKRGEQFKARVRAAGEASFVGSGFSTPSQSGSIVVERTRRTCKPPDCDCVDLGEITVKFDKPRLCEAKVRVTFNGDELAGAEGSLSAGDALASARVRADLIGGMNVSASALAALCRDQSCGLATTDAEGVATLRVPVVGEAPRIQLFADFESAAQGGAAHYYSGKLTIEGCAADVAALDVEQEVQVSHAQLGELEFFLAGLAAKAKASGDVDEGDDASLFCGCRVAGAEGKGRLSAIAGALALTLALWIRRRQRRGGEVDPD